MNTHDTEEKRKDGKVTSQVTKKSPNLHITNQTKRATYQSNKTIAIMISMSKYDRVLRPNVKGAPKPELVNNPQAEQECNIFR